MLSDEHEDDIGLLIEEARQDRDGPAVRRLSRIASRFRRLPKYERLLKAREDNPTALDRLLTPTRRMDLGHYVQQRRAHLALLELEKETATR